MKNTKKAVRKSAEARKKAEDKKVAQAECADNRFPLVQIVSESIVPNVLYKYTDDAGVSGLREGIVRFGSFEEYRETENNAIRDPYENAVHSRPIPVYDSAAKSRNSLSLILRLPGAVFCASMDSSLRGAFPKYNRRVAIKRNPFIRMLTNAIVGSHRIFEKRQCGKITQVQFRYDRWGRGTNPNEWDIIYPKEYFAFMEMGPVHYVKNDALFSKAHPLGLLTAVSIGGEIGGRMIYRQTQTDCQQVMRKPCQHSHEKEFRLALSFGAGKDIEASSVYHTESFFVKIDNPDEVFTFD